MSKLQSGAKYTFSVIANKTKKFEASVAVVSNEIIAPTLVPAPTLKKVSATNSSITFQVTNWDKMEAALQEVDKKGESGCLSVSIIQAASNKNNEDEDLYTEVFSYVADGEGNWSWASTENNSNTIEISVVNKKKIATITINELDSNTNYKFKAGAESMVTNDNINTVLPVTSKVLNAKTNA